MKLPNLATDKNRWWALIFLALSLAIVIIDNNVLNVAIPYILRDLHTTFDSIQWVISGYALIIATILITVGRIGDVIGRKKLFVLGTALFAIGSFIASVSPNVLILFIGEAFIEAIGAAMMLTSSLALLVTEFQGKERAIAFGVWGAVAGASASFGPLLGGFLTTYYSWRWSLRINVFVAIIAILGSVFIKEARGEKTKLFDWFGTLFSGLGLFFLVFGFIEGPVFGWWTLVKQFSILGWTWPLTTISVIPFSFALSAIFLLLFVWIEYKLEKKNSEPLLRLSLFKNSGFTLGLLALATVVMGQFGAFFIFPIYIQNVLNLTAFQTGIVFLWSSVAIIFVGPASGFLSSRFGPKWVVVVGMFSSFLGILWVSIILSTTSNWITLGPSLILFGIGIGMASAQLTNIILSHVPQQFSGEASAVNATFRQVGTSIGIALIGSILAANLSSNIVKNVHADRHFPPKVRAQIANKIKNINAESGTQSLQSRLPSRGICSELTYCMKPQQFYKLVRNDINQGLVDAAKSALHLGLIFVGIGLLFSLFLPGSVPITQKVSKKKK